jgi:hypothetical protein
MNENEDRWFDQLADSRVRGLAGDGGPTAGREKLLAGVRAASSEQRESPVVWPRCPLVLAGHRLVGNASLPFRSGTAPAAILD